MEFVQYACNGAVAEIILNRPDAHHALNEQMLCPATGCSERCRRVCHETIRSKKSGLEPEKAYAKERRTHV